MKKLSMILLALVFIMTSCNDKDSIWNVMGDMDSRISCLEALCQEMNTNISALETLIKAQDNGDYITNITEIRNGSTIVGYTITFKVHAPITVYNGTNGKDGTNGYTPLLGAKQDTDGIYYWTVDGNWLTDTDGNKLRVSGEKGDKGDKGDQGDKGQDGTNGVNGNTPQLKIDGGYWYLSYDGTNWSKLGKATGENGTNGSDGAKGDKGDKGDAGDTMFRSVTQDDNYVYFTLADGTLIKIAKNGSTSGGTHADTDIIEFRDLNVKAALLRYTPAIDTNGDGEISYAEAKAVKVLNVPYKIGSGSDAKKVGADIVSFKEFQYFTGIEDFSFSEALNLVEITLPEGLNKIPNSAFYSTAIHSITIPSSVKQIGSSAFSSSALSNIIFEEGCTEIKSHAFNNCTKLYSISLPNTVKTIGEGAFFGSYITSFAFPRLLTNLSCPMRLYRCKTIYWNTINLTTPCMWQNGSSSEYGLRMDNVENIYFGNEVKTIPAGLCCNMNHLKEVSIPDNVEIIGSYAFCDCDSLSIVTIGDGCTTIETSTFSSCTSLTEVTIGKNVRTIGDYGFYSSGGKLKRIYCKAQQPPIIGNLAVPTTINVIYVPRQSVDEYRVVWSDYASKILGYDFE